MTSNEKNEIDYCDFLTKPHGFITKRKLYDYKINKNLLKLKKS